MAKRNPNRREFLMLAHDYEEGKHGLAGYYASEKLDGIRMFWDGGITRGLPAVEVPWANTAKHDRFKVPLKATGLWSRYGQPIQAPDWWLDKLPRIPLDGEAWAGRGQWEFVSSVVKTLSGEDKGWDKIKYMVFDSPCLNSVLAHGEVNNPNFKKKFLGCLGWCKQRFQVDIALGRIEKWPDQMPGEWPFYRTLNWLNSWQPNWQNDYVQLHQQIKLPATKPQAKELLDKLLADIESKGGEGIILRDPMLIWTPQRTHSLLKLKAYKDAEATVIGYTWGKESDNTRTVNGDAQSKLLGYMGSLTLDFNGKVFNLSGFTNSERRMNSLYEADTIKAGRDAYLYGLEHPGEKVDITRFVNPMFPLGSKVTFRFRELTAEGLPKEARYFRKASEI